MNEPNQLESIFFAALERDSPKERAAYLDAACRNHADLRRQVDRLLQAHPKLGNFLTNSIVEQLTGEPSSSSLTEEVAVGRDRKQTPHSDRTEQEPAENDVPTLDFLQPATRADSLGRIGHYEVLEVLGKGGFGIVFRALDEKLQRVVAVKALAPHFAATSPARKRFLREARAYAKVRHENIVQVYAVEEEPLPYLVMEYIPGESLQQRLDRKGPLEATEIVSIGRQIADGLAAAHATGLIHRDIKPSNILIETGAAGRVKLTDFGLARAADDASATQTGVVAGTPMYMSPEQATGAAIDHRTDLFSLGSVLYTMCAGRPPFRASATLAVMKRVADDTPRPIPEIIPDAPRWLCDVIGKLHTKDPAKRFGSAREVSEVLAAGRQPAAATMEASQPGRRLQFSDGPSQSQSLSRHRGLVAAAAVLLMLAGGLSLTEATGVTDLRGTVIRLFSPEGTLVIEVDDPGVNVAIDGGDVIITGAGVKEIRMKPGQYKVTARKDGKTVREELVRVERNGKQVVRVSREATGPLPDLTAGPWERSVAGLPADEQLQAVLDRLKKLNPSFHGKIERGQYLGEMRVAISGPGIHDLSPVRGLADMTWLEAREADVKLADLTPLRGLNLVQVIMHNSRVVDLSPLVGMKLVHLDMTLAKTLTDLTPLHGMPMKVLSVPYTSVRDLTPLQEMKLEYLNCTGTPVSDLAPLRGMPLGRLHLVGTAVAELKPLIGAPLQLLDCARTPISDLTPLQNMTQLNELFVQDTAVNDLTPLKKLPLKILNCSNTQVSDLTPLAGLKLTQLYCDGTTAPDLMPLRGMPLEILHCRGYDLQSETNRAVLRSLKSLAVINSTPAAEFWRELDRK